MTETGIVKTAIPCGCGCGCVVLVDCPWGDEPRELYVEFSLAFHAGLRYRLRACWRVLRGKDPWLHCVALEADGIQKLKEALDG